jgi:hypothetical protein
MKKLLVVLITLVMICTSSTVFAADELLVMSDIFVVKPLGVASIVVGTAMYVVSLPIALLTRSEPETKRIFLEEPYKFTFNRPLGDTGTQARR